MTNLSQRSRGLNDAVKAPETVPLVKVVAILCPIEMLIYAAEAWSVSIFRLDRFVNIISMDE